MSDKPSSLRKLVPCPNERRWWHLENELRQTVGLLESGLGLLQRYSLRSDRLYSTLLVLASGLERLLKILLHLHKYHSQSSFLSVNDMRKYSHNLDILLTDVLEHCFTTAYTTDPLARRDELFLREDKHFRILLHVLNDFAWSDRYLVLDLIADPQHPQRSLRALPSERVQDSRLFAGLAILDALEHPEALEEGELARLSDTQLVQTCERALRALCRLIKRRRFGAGATYLSGPVARFADLQDGDLGKQNYA